MFGGTGRGGAIDIGSPGTLVVSNSTFVNNSASGGMVSPSRAKGAAVRFRIAVTAFRSLIARCQVIRPSHRSRPRRRHRQCERFRHCDDQEQHYRRNAATTGVDVNGSFTSAGFNLIGQTDGSIGIYRRNGSDRTAAAPRSQARSEWIEGQWRSDLTIALVLGSPALDKGSSAGLAGNLTTISGSGFPESSTMASCPSASGGDGTDIGAFELQTGQPTPTPTATPTATATATPPPTTLANISTRLAGADGRQCAHRRIYRYRNTAEESDPASDWAVTRACRDNSPIQRSNFTGGSRCSRPMTTGKTSRQPTSKR